MASESGCTEVAGVMLSAQRVPVSILVPSDPNAPTPALVPAQTPIPTGWTELGCIAEAPSGRALTGASTTSPNMTRAACVDFCASKGFSIAGAEFSDECYCDDEMRNGATMDLVIWNECTNHCAGNSK